MQRISIQLKKPVDDSYDIHLEKGFFQRIASDLRMKKFAEQYVVITDKKVNRHYGKKLEQALKREQIFLAKLVVPEGEKSKSISQFSELQEKLVDLGAHRQTGIIALGGGVVGDLAGFVAASFMRGVPYVQIPTSLLAMVDSSVGGKVGIDLPDGKNLVGAFWQPKKVYIDPEVLSTLSQKHWKAGLGEAIKYGAIKDRQLWEFFEHHSDLWNKKPSDFLPSDWKVIEEMILRCVTIKAEVVMKDEKEGNFRQILNYGHTFGHVIEKMSDYEILHGEAVAVGMRIAAALAEELRVLPSAERERQNALLDELKIGKSKTRGLVSDFVKHMKKDKKAKGDVKVVLINRLGACYQQMGHFGITVDEKVLKKVLKDSGLVDDVQPVQARPSASVYPSYSSAHTVSPSSGLTGYSAPSSSGYQAADASQQPEETELQRRLRLMRERREQGSQGGFLPG